MRIIVLWVILEVIKFDCDMLVDLGDSFLFGREGESFRVLMNGSAFGGEKIESFILRIEIVDEDGVGNWGVLMIIDELVVIILR